MVLFMVYFLVFILMWYNVIVIIINSNYYGNVIVSLSEDISMGVP